MSCVFCDIVSGENTEHEIIWRDDAHVAFLDRSPVAIGHVLVIPAKHVDYVFDMESEDYLALMKAVRTVAGPLKRASGKARVMLVLEGFSVPHVHAHLVPNSNDEDRIKFNHSGMDNVDLAAVARQLRPHLV